MFCKCRAFCNNVTALCHLGSVTNCMHSSVVLDTNVILFLYHTLVYSRIVLFSLFLLY